jgi:hypothetical protein
MKKWINLLVLGALTVGCASKSKQMHEKIRAEAKQGNLESAIAMVKSDDFYPEKNSKLLKLMEESLLHHLKGDYYQAMMELDQAKELSDQLFTVSLSKKVGAAVVNSNVDNYYGETYERSMIRFYQAINHYSLYRNGKYEAYKFEEKDPKGKVIATKEMPEKVLTPQERQFHLTASRSTLLEWNALLDNYKSTTGGQPVYKDDLLAKIFGAFIHEEIGSANDKSIAIGLYREAKNVLLRNYNLLPTYNKKNAEFAKNFDKFATMEEADVVKNYVEKTSHSTELESFIDAQIARLTGKGEPNSLYILLENNFITPKEAKKFEFPIPTDSIPAAIPGADFVSFASQVLKTAAGSLPTIYFEMPGIKNSPPVVNQVVRVKDSKGAVVGMKKLVTLNPLTDMANFNLKQDIVSNYAKVGTRVALKHIAALATAYVAYNKGKDKSEALALLGATSIYSGLNKAIKASEEADLRGWTILPHMYSLTNFSLKPGKYSVEYQHNDKVISLGEVTVTGSETNFIKQRIYE